MQAVFSRSSNVIHACDDNPNERGYYHSKCGKMTWSEKTYAEHKTQCFSVNCQCCLASMAGDELRDRAYLAREANRRKGELNSIRGAVELLLNQAAVQVSNNPLGVKMGDSFWNLQMNKQPTEIFDLLAHVIRKSISFSAAGISILANNPELVSIMKILPVILDKLVLTRVFDLKCEKEDLRKKLNQATKVTNEEIEELSADLAEAEEENRKLMGDNDDQRDKLRKLNDIING